MAENYEIPTSLSEGVKIYHPSLDVADTGEIIVMWGTETRAKMENFKDNPVPSNMESKWEDHKVVCTSKEEAWEKMKALYDLLLKQEFAEKDIMVVEK